MTEQAYIGLGGNLGDREAALSQACDLIGGVIGRSGIFQTEPIGPEQPAFLNQVILIETQLDPGQLLQHLLDIELQLGRERRGARWGPRTIDLDLLLMGDRIVDRPGLKVPHPHLTQRSFVLVPLLELTPDLRHPVSAQPLRDCLEALRESDDWTWIEPHKEPHGDA